MNLPAQVAASVETNRVLGSSGTSHSLIFWDAGRLWGAILSNYEFAANKHNNIDANEITGLLIYLSEFNIDIQKFEKNKLSIIDFHIIDLSMSPWFLVGYRCSLERVATLDEKLI